VGGSEHVGGSKELLSI